MYAADPARLREIERQREEFNKAAAALQNAVGAAQHDPSKVTPPPSVTSAHHTDAVVFCVRVCVLQLQALLDAIERLKRAANGLRDACKSPANELRDLQKTIGAQVRSRHSSSS